MVFVTQYTILSLMGKFTLIGLYKFRYWLLEVYKNSCNILRYSRGMGTKNTLQLTSNKAYCCVAQEHKKYSNIANINIHGVVCVTI